MFLVDGERRNCTAHHSDRCCDLVGGGDNEPQLGDLKVWLMAQCVEWNRSLVVVRAVLGAVVVGSWVPVAVGWVLLLLWVHCGCGREKSLLWGRWWWV